jgi:hypothetical protein
MQFIIGVSNIINYGNRRGRARMIVVFTIIYAIRAYHNFQEVAFSTRTIYFIMKYILKYC